MSFDSILLYSIRAVRFAFVMSLIYALVKYVIYKIKNKKINIKEEIINIAFVFYLCSLIQITVIRSGISFGDVINASYDSVSLTPFINSAYQINNGIWAFIYPVFGNILWFVPFGIFMPLIFKEKITLLKLTLFAFALSLSIEILQFVFASGISDIDDIIFNVSGAVSGYLLYTFIKKKQNKDLNKKA